MAHGSAFSSRDQELPQFLGSERPAPESWPRRLVIRGVAIATIVVTAVYLTWRTTSTVDLSVWCLAIPLLLAELHSAFGLTLYTLALWDVDVGPDWRPATRTGHRIAVLLPTYEEPEEVLLPSVVAAIALEPAHETWVLDDGDRPWVRALANELGARYLARAEHDHAKAGNLNHALQTIDADVIAVFDADHVVQPNFLRHTLAYFDDPAIAVVQTPQDFYNLESFEHEGTTHSDERPYHEEANFHRVIGPAMNHWGGAFWCGTGALIRVAALRDVGLVATGTVTEDIHTTIRMNRRGWRAVYHNEVLARGLAPSDASQYMLQRHRWALGAMQVQRAERPLTQRGLTFGQRLAFATTLFGWLDSSRTLAFMVLPIAVVISGSSPIDAPGEIYGPAFAATFVMQFAALRLLARGYSPPLRSLLFEVLRMPAVLPATLAVISDGKGARSEGTPRGAAEGRDGIPIPWLLRVTLAGSAGALIWFSATIVGLTPSTYHELPAAFGAVGFLLMNITLLLMATSRIRDPRFRSDRRASVRFGVRLFGAINGARCEIEDLSTTGAKVVITGGTRFAPFEANLGVDLPDGRTLRLSCAVRRRMERTDGFEVGLAFADGQRATLGEISLALLQQRDRADPAPRTSVRAAA